jgi:hypothetical protein
MKPEFKPFKAKPLASDWKTELADPDEWALTEYEEDEYEPMLFVRQMIAALARETLLNMRGPR